MNGVRPFGSESGAYQSGWDDGYASGLRQAASSDRAAAFGAIRRAAEVARRHDHKHTDYCAEHGESWTSPGRCEASAIRYAIRAAIGSPKA